MNKYLPLFILLFAFHTFGQIKKPVKPAVSVSESEAITKDGKKVILKSDGTWQNAPINTTKTNETSCQLMLKDSPNIRGLKLGMFNTKVRDVVGDDFMLFQKEEPNGVKTTTLYDTSLKDKSDFNGVARLILSFYEWQIHKIDIKYDESAVNLKNEELKAKLIETFNLPSDNWENSNPSIFESIITYSGQELTCKDFKVEVIRGNEILLTNLLTTKNIEENEKKKRDTFKP